MRKIKKFIFNLILFSFYTNFSMATSQITYDVENTNHYKKALVFTGIFVIIIVLYISYRIDKKDEIKVKKDRYKKNNYNIKTQKNKEVIVEVNTKDVNTNSIKKTSDETIMLNYASLKKIEIEKKELAESDLRKEIKPEVYSTMKINVINKGKPKEEKIEKEKDNVIIPKEEDILRETTKRYTRKKKRNIKKYTRKK